MQNSVDELLTLRRLQVNGRLTKAPRILEDIWCPPLLGGLKSTGWGSFWRPRSRWLFWRVSFMQRLRQKLLAIPLGACFAFEAELAVVVHAIEYTWSFSWKWMRWESNSTYLVALLRSHSHRVPWRWRLFWKRCLGYFAQMHFVVTHV